jgi:hypothetical protein
VVAAVGVGPAGRVHGGGARHPVTGSVPAVGGWIWFCGDWPAGDVRVCVCGCAALGLGFDGGGGF